MVKGLSDYVCVGTISRARPRRRASHTGRADPDAEPPPSPTTAPPILTIGSIADVARVARLAGPGDRQVAVVDAALSVHPLTNSTVSSPPRQRPGLDVAGYALASPAGRHRTAIALPRSMHGSTPVDADCNRCGSVISSRQSYSRPPRPPSRSPVPPAARHRLVARRQVVPAIDAPTSLAVHQVDAGDRAGYQLTEVPGDGQLVLVSAGSAHGVAAIARRCQPVPLRPNTACTLLEPPHMHTSMLFVPDGAALPGDWRSRRRADDR